MKLSSALILLTVAVGTATAFTLSMSAVPHHDTASKSLDRRSFIRTTAAGIATVGLASPVLAEDEPYADFITTESGMKYKVLKEGDGAVPSPGMTVKAHYTGWLDDFDSIRKFDSSRDRGRPFTFKVGTGQVSKATDSVGWFEMFQSHTDSCR